MDERSKVKAELEQAKKERDDVKVRYAELHKKADTLLKRAKDGETSQKERADSIEVRLNELTNDVRTEKEARARERAQAEAAQEKLQKQLADATLKGNSDAEGKLETLRAAVKDKDERLAKATVENSHYRERAREAIARAKELESQLATVGPDDTTKRSLEEYKTKYNESVGRLKAQTEMNKQTNEKNRDLNEKLRKAVGMIEEYKRRALAGSAMSTQTQAPPVKVEKPAPAAPFDEVDDVDGMVNGGESTLILENPLMKKP